MSSGIADRLKASPKFQSFGKNFQNALLSLAQYLRDDDLDACLSCTVATQVKIWEMVDSGRLDQIDHVLRLLRGQQQQQQPQQRFVDPGAGAAAAAAAAADDGTTTSSTTRLHHKIDLGGVLSSSDDDNGDDGKNASAAQEEARDSSEKPAEEAEDPLAALARLEAEEHSARHAVESASAAVWESVVEEHNNSDAVIRHDIEGFDFWAAGRHKRDWAKGEAAFRRHKASHRASKTESSNSGGGSGGGASGTDETGGGNENDESNKNDDGDEQQRQQEEETEFTLRGAAAFARLARKYRGGGARSQDEYFECAGGKRHNGWTAAGSAVQALLKNKAQVEDLLEGEHRYRKIAPRSSTDEAEGSARFGRSSASGAGGFGKGSGSGSGGGGGGNPPELQRQRLLVEMLVLLCEWSSDAHVVAGPHFPLTLHFAPSAAAVKKTSSGEQGDDNEDEDEDEASGAASVVVVKSRETYLLLLLRILLFGRGCCRGLPLWIIVLVQKLLLELLAIWQSQREERRRAARTKDDVREDEEIGVHLDWLLRAVLEHCCDDGGVAGRRTYLLLRLFVEIFEHRDSSDVHSETHAELRGLGARLLSSIEDGEGEDNDADDGEGGENAAQNAAESSRAKRRFSFAYMRFLGAQEQQQQLDGSIDTTGAATTSEHRRVAAFIARHYIVPEPRASGAGGGGDDEQRVPDDVLLLVIRTMAALRIPTLPYATAAGSSASTSTTTSSASQQHTARSIFQAVDHTPAMLGNYTAPRRTRYFVARAALAVAVHCDDNDSSAVSTIALPLFHQIDAAALQSVWFTADAAEALRRQQQRQELVAAADSAFDEDIAMPEAVESEFLQEYGAWVRSLIPLFAAQKRELEAAQKAAMRAVANEFSVAFDSGEIVTTYRRVTAEHNVRMRSRFGRLLLDTEDEEEIQRFVMMRELTAQYTPVDTSFFPRVLLPFCSGGAALVLEETAVRERIAEHCRAVVAECLARERALLVAVTEPAARRNVLKEEERLRNHIVQDLEAKTRLLRVQLIKYTTVVKDVDGLSFLVNGDSLREERSGSGIAAGSSLGTIVHVYDVLHVFSRLPWRSVPRLLLERQTYVPEAFSLDGGKTKQIRYRLNTSTSKSLAAAVAAAGGPLHYPSLRQILQLPDDIFFGRTPVPEKTTAIDFLFLAGAWVRGDDTAEGYAWAYNAQQPSTSTYNPRRNWCLPAQLFEESGTSTSMCFAPSVAFAAEMFPDPKAASSGLSLAAAPAAAAAASSGLLQPSRSSALLNLPTLLMDAHGNVFEEVGVDDRGAKIIMPTADGDLSWVAVYVLKNHADLWRCRVSATDPTRVDFEFVITETRYADLLAAIRVPDIVSFDDSDSSPLDALKRDGIITGPFRAESAEEEEGGGGDDGAVVERYYHEGQRKELDNAEEEWLLPADDAEALPPPMPEE